MPGLGTNQFVLIVAMALYSVRQNNEEGNKRSGGMLRERTAAALAPRHPTKHGGWRPSTVRSLRRLRQLVAPGLTGAAARMMRLALVDLLGTDNALTEVVLVEQRLEHFPVELFSGMLKLPLAQIRLLDLRFNRVSVLPPRINQMSHLTCLRLTGNCLSTLPPEISQLASLQELQLGENTLERVPEVVTQLPALHTLGLAGNSLTSLPDSLRHLRSLTCLDVSRNHLATLPAQAVGALTSLTTLDVSDNRLTALPASIGLCHELREVGATNNALVYVPHELGHLPQLVRFSMAGCPASVVVEGLARAPLPTLDAAKLVLRADDESVGTLDGVPVAVTPLHGRCAAAASLVLWPATHAALPNAVGVLRASAAAPSYALITAQPASVAGQEMTRLGAMLSAAAARGAGFKCKSEVKLQREQAVKIAADVCAALLYLHSNHVCHGEVRGDAVMAALGARGDGTAVLGGLGSLFGYVPEEQSIWEAVDMCAYGQLLRALVAAGEETEPDVAELADDCTLSSPLARPTFASVAERLVRMRMGRVMKRTSSASNLSHGMEKQQKRSSVQEDSAWQGHAAVPVMRHSMSVGSSINSLEEDERTRHLKYQQWSALQQSKLDKASSSDDDAVPRTPPPPSQPLLVP